MNILQTRHCIFVPAALVASIALTAGRSADAPSLEEVLAENPYATADELGLMKGFPPPPDRRVTRENALLSAPYNRWSYLRMRTIYPSAPIPRADRGAPLDKTLDWSLEQLEIAEPGGGMTDMATYLERTYSDAIVVVRGETVVYERFLNGMHGDQPHQMMSVTKSFGGLLGLLAVAEGRLAEDQLVVDHVPELKSATAFVDATFGHVLDMTNSMDFSEDYADPASGIRKYGATLGWTAKVEGVTYEDSLYDFLKTLPIDPEHAHGEVFHYQTPKTDVVNWVTNRVNGASFQDAMYERLWSPIGATGETYVLLDNNGTLVAGGGLNATPYDLARFATMMAHEGRFRGRQVVPASVVAELSKGGDIAAFDAGPDSDGLVYPKGEWSYRAQWWIRHTPGLEAVLAIGIHGQWIYIDVERDIAIVKQSSQPLSKDDYLNLYDLNAFTAIVEHLGAR